MRQAFDGSRQRAGQVSGERDEDEERGPRDDKEAGDDEQGDDGLELARPAALEVLARAHGQAGAFPSGAKEQRVGGGHDQHRQHEAHQERVHVVPLRLGHLVVRQEAKQRAERGEQPHDNHHDVVEVDGHRAMADRRDDGETALEADGGELEDRRGAVEDVEGDVEEVDVHVAGHRVERVERVVRPQRDRYEADEEVAQGQAHEAHVRHGAKFVVHLESQHHQAVADDDDGGEDGREYGRDDVLAIVAVVGFPQEARGWCGRVQRPHRYA